LSFINKTRVTQICSPRGSDHNKAILKKIQKIKLIRNRFPTDYVVANKKKHLNCDVWAKG